MIVLVCGGRAHSDVQYVEAVLYQEADRAAKRNERLVVIQGGAKGADRIARHWCKRNGQPCATWSAWWGQFGKSAGPIRNTWMLKYGRPDKVIAFPGGAGTADMVWKAERAGVPVRKVGW